MERQAPPQPTNSRIRRTTRALLSVCGAFGLYSLVFVPVIEPADELTPPASPQTNLAPRNYAFEKWFPEGSWERNRPKILVTDQGTLLFDQDEPSADGLSLELKRCTLIFFTAGAKQSVTNVHSSFARPKERRCSLTRRST